MNKVIALRKRLGLSQKELANQIGKSQGTISNVELGIQDLMPEDARQVICIARKHGIDITFDDIYDLPEECQSMVCEEKAA